MGISYEISGGFFLDYFGYILFLLIFPKLVLLIKPWGQLVVTVVLTSFGQNTVF